MVTPEEIYRRFYLIRRVEEEIARVYPTDKIQSPVHLSIGQELASVAVCSALEKRDKVFGSYRSHALYLAKGGDLPKFIAELYGKVTGCASGKGGSMHVVEPNAGVLGTSAIVGSLIPVAAGFAWAQKKLGTGIVTACFFGDGATEEGCYFEALNFAAVHKLPILFVCENNGYAIHTPTTARQATPIATRAASLGIPAASVSDFDEVFVVANGLTSWVRDGGGPNFIEIRVPRLKEHVGVAEDWSLGYRCEDRTWKDPVRLAEERIPAGQQERIRSGVECEIADAFAFAENSAVPGPEELMADTYG